jgi:FkbH-like protein
MSATTPAPDTEIPSGAPAHAGTPGGASGPASAPSPTAAPTYSPVPAAERLRTWHEAGELAVRFPEVCRLLTELSTAELARAGRLLAGIDPADVLEVHPNQSTITVATTGHGTLSALVPALSAQLARHGLLLRSHSTDFDSYLFELSDPNSALYAADPDLALCVLDAQVVLDELPNPWRAADVEAVLDAKVAVFEKLAIRFAESARGTLVFNTLPLPRALTAQLVDLRSRARVGAAWREANARLLRLMEDHACVVVLDLEPMREAGTDPTTNAIPISDARMSRYAKVHLSPELLGAYATEVGHLARHLTGRGRKCLVLDLDGTVWGGILGDDGPEGIEVAQGYRGEAFRAFQKVARQIASQGVLLAAVSKNDVDPVREVLREHPEMSLREDDFVRVIANWRPKHDNLRELAADLNVGVDSFVFVDDSPYECGLVRRELPEVAVVALDTEPALHIEKLLRDGWFDTRELTAEDQARPARYRDELVRRDFLDSFDSVEGYLRELGVTVTLAEVRERDVPRVSQVTLRTNQFNLTGHRLQPDDVRALRTDPDALPLAIHAADRFGENGLVGAVFVRHQGDALHIDNFLLSCRVFARGIEQACLAAVLRNARATGASAVIGTYRRTAKNAKVAELYVRAGFTLVDPRSGLGDPSPDGPPTDRLLTFRHDLAEADIPAHPTHVRLTESFGGAPGRTAS